MRKITVRFGFLGLSILQPEFLEGLGLEQVQLQLGQLFQGQGLDALGDFRGQQAELRFQLAQRRPPLSLEITALAGGDHEGLDLLVCFGAH